MIVESVVSWFVGKGLATFWETTARADEVKALEKKFRSAAIAWHKKLTREEFELDSYEFLFRTADVNNSDPKDPMNVIRQKLCQQELPSLEQWQHALYRQRDLLIEDYHDNRENMQSFFRQENDSEAHAALDQLAQEFHKICQNHGPMFQGKTLDSLERIQTQLTNLASLVQDQGLNTTFRFLDGLLADLRSLADSDVRLFFLLHRIGRYEIPEGADHVNGDRTGSFHDSLRALRNARLIVAEENENLRGRFKGGRTIVVLSAGKHLADDVANERIKQTTKSGTTWKSIHDNAKKEGNIQKTLDDAFLQTHKNDKV